MLTKLKSGRLPAKYFHVVGLLIAVLSPTDGKAATPDRLISLMQAARGSSCFLSPSRPATTETLPSSVVGAAFQGEASAMYRLAEAYLGDQLSGPSGKQALPWFERAATAGQVVAAADVGRIYAAGRGMPADPKQAFAWWMFGATRGDPRSMACVSVSYLLGYGVLVDTVEAARWAILRDAASAGQTLLGPSTADMERALPASEMLAARRRAMEMLEPTPPPQRDAPLPGAAVTGVS